MALTLFFLFLMIFRRGAWQAQPESVVECETRK